VRGRHAKLRGQASRHRRAIHAEKTLPLILDRFQMLVTLPANLEVRQHLLPLAGREPAVKER